MMKKYLLVTTIIAMMVLVGGCGKKNVTETVSQNNTETVLSVDENAIVTEEPEKQEEEVIGDVDVDGIITMDSMVENVIGLDIPIRDDNGDDAYSTFGKDLCVLVPNASLQTKQSEYDTIYEQKNIRMDIIAAMVQDDAGEPGMTLKDSIESEKIGNYYFITTDKYITNTLFNYGFAIVNSENGSTVCLYVNGVHAENVSEFAEEYYSALIETIKNSLQ